MHTVLVIERLDLVVCHEDPVILFADPIIGAHHLRCDIVSGPDKISIYSGSVGRGLVCARIYGHFA